MEAAAIPAVRARTGLARWAFLGGAVYVVLFVIGVLVFYGGQPDSGSAPAKLIAYYSDSGHRDRINIGWILIGLAAFFLIWFVAALRRAVAAVDGERILTSIVAFGGSIYIALLLVAVSIGTALTTMSDDTYHHQVYPGLIHAANDVSWVVHAAGAAALGAMIIAASLAFMRGGVWPTWAGWVGIVVGILALASIVFFPQFLFLAWILVVSIVLFMRESRTTEPRVS
jgi:hypothetical protein